MAEHTQTPWHIAGEGGDFGVFSGTQTEKGNWVNSQQVLPFFDCDLQQGNYGKNHMADGEFIVRAVNCHDALLEACKLCANALKDHIQYDDGESLERSGYDTAIAAIAKADC